MRRNFTFSLLAALLFAHLGAGTARAEAPEPAGLSTRYPDAERIARNKALTQTQWAAILRPMQLIDDTFYLSEGDPAVLAFDIANPEDKTPAEPHLMIDLDAGVTILGAPGPATLVSSTPLPDGRVRHDHAFQKRSKIYTSRDGLSNSHALGIMVKTTKPAGASLQDMEFRFRDGTVEGPTSRMKLAVLPAIRARTPADFKVGLMFRSPVFRPEGEAVRQAFGPFVKRCGVSVIYGDKATDTGASCAAAGIEVLSGAGLYNGFMFSSRRPEDVAFVNSMGKPVAGALCPTAVHQGHPYVEQAVYEESIKRYIATEDRADHLTRNWEPYMFFGKGCFCNRCRKEFVAWSELPAEEIEKEWPLGVLRKRKPVWERFAAMQHGWVVRKLEAYTRKAGAEVGKVSHFAPMLTPHMATAGKDREYGARMADLEQYVHEIGMINFWGGYTTWSPLDERRRPVGARLGLLHYLEFVTGYFQRPAFRKKRPVLTWAHGSLLGTKSVTFPEGITFDILCCFLNGIDQTWAYVFPRGYDNRYWAAVAKAADTAAVLDPYVRQGRRVEGTVSIEPVSPLPEVEDGPLVRVLAFESNGALLAAVGNFWLSGEAFVRLKIDGLAEGMHALIDPVANTRLGAPRESGWTAAELRDGVLVHAGNLRWAPFLVVSADAAPPTRATVTQADVERAIQERLPSIKAAFAESTVRIEAQRKARDGETFDYSALKPLRAGELACTVSDVDGDGQPDLVYNKPGEEIVVSPGLGARVLHWRIGGVDVVQKLGPHDLAVDATWMPAAFADKATEILEHAVTDDGLLLKTRFTFTNAARGCLPGLQIVRELTVPASSSGFRARVTLVNGSDDDQELAYRMTGTVSLLATVKDDARPGWLQFRTGQGPYVLERNFLKNEFHLDGRERNARLDGWGMDNTGVILEPKVRFGRPGVPFVIEASMEHDDFYKLVVWDAGMQAVPTAEFVSTNIRLEPGATWQTSFQWQSIPQ